MRNEVGRGLFRFFFTLLGVGVGVLLVKQIFPLLTVNEGFFQQPYAYPVSVGASVLLFGLAFFALSDPIHAGLMKLVNRFSRHMDGMTSSEMLISLLGLLTGLIIAALTSRLILAAGSNLFTISFSALLYIIFGYSGVHIAQRRRRKRKKGEVSRLEKLGSELLEDGDEEDISVGVQAKVLDSSVLIDGRVMSVIRCGFLEGELILPQAVLMELQKLADSTEEEKRRIGKRGLDMAQNLREVFPITCLEGTGENGSTDVQLLKLCKEHHYALVTNDTNLQRLCGVEGVKALSLSALSDALKPPVSAGDHLNVSLRRLGKADGQAIGYLEDGTMVVVDGAAQLVGNAVECEVSQVRSNASGRIVFARIHGAS